MDARTSSRQKRLSRKQEVQMAKDLGGRVTPGSGSRSHSKGDVRVQGKTRGEAKFTGKSSYVLKLSVLEKIQKEALEGGLEEPVLQVGFTRLSKIEVAFAIWPLQPGKSFVFYEDGCTFAKSLILSRTTLQRQLLDEDRIFICFESSNLLHTPKWYAISLWDDYLKWRAEHA